MRIRNRTLPGPAPVRWLGWSGLALALALIGCDSGMDELEPETTAAPPGNLAPQDEDWTREVPPENQLSPEEFDALERGTPAAETTPDPIDDTPGAETTPDPIDDTPGAEVPPEAGTPETEVIEQPREPGAGEVRPEGDEAGGVQGPEGRG
jgi:hypothetical protein